MALPQADRGASLSPDTPRGRAFQNYCDGHLLYAELKRLRAAGTHERRFRDWSRLELIRGQLLADYLRATHADERAAQGHSRILTWLQSLRGKDEPQYCGLHYEVPLSVLAMSHGQPVDWFASKLREPPVSYASDEHVHAYPLGNQRNEKVHWTLIAWLLRLADIMDFDPTRTPSVVFEHLGIVDPKSKEEWLKHLAISGRPYTDQSRPETLLYRVNECPSPRIEKALRQYCRSITEELESVRRVHAAMPSQYRLPLSLPSAAEPSIAQRLGDYQYLDLEFRLDREAIFDLVMGEALYGEPELALRELVQNALDAVHLRELRDYLHNKLQGHPEAEFVPPVERLGKEEQLEVHVTWGTTEGRSFVTVEDNGVGMSESTIQTYLTQIGKSYYRSSEFARERAWMRRELEGEGAILAALSPISQFGIGFLSCFMLADRITVRTRASGKEPQAWRVEIDGPHGFISLYPDDRDAPRPSGTEVTLWLKAALAPFNRMRFVEKLRKELFDIRGPWREDNAPDGIGPRSGPTAVEPAFAVARYVLWPLYPVFLEPPDAEAVKLDREMAFLMNELVPLDGEAIRAKAREWELDPALVGQPVWDPYTWCDATETGSQVRFIVPRSNGPSPTREAWLRFEDSGGGRIPQWVLSAFAETRLPRKGRTWVLVNGIRVPEFAQYLPFGNGVGSLAFVDLRGEAAPRLRADRKGTVSLSKTEQASIEGLGHRALDKLRPWTVAEARWRCHSVLGPLDRPVTPAGGGAEIVPIVEQTSMVMMLGLIDLAVKQECGATRDLAVYLHGDRDRDRDLAIAIDRCRAYLDDDLDLDIASNVTRARVLDLAFILLPRRPRQRPRPRLHPRQQPPPRPRRPRPRPRRPGSPPRSRPRLWPHR